MPARVRRSEGKAGLRQMTDAEDKQVEAIFPELAQVKRYNDGEWGTNV